MRQLTELGIRHQSTSVGPGKTLAVFPTVAARDFALGMLAAAGFDVAASDGRGLLAVAPLRDAVRQHEVLIKRVAWHAFLILFTTPFCAPYYAWKLWGRYRAPRPAAPDIPLAPAEWYAARGADSRFWNPAPQRKFYAGSHTPRHRKA